MKLQYPQLEAIRHGLIVSCQAGPESPLNAPCFIAALAKSSEMGGAVGFRVDRPENVSAVRAISSLPILGIYKIVTRCSDVYITPTYASAEAVVKAGANLLAIDATGRPRSGGETFRDIVEKVHKNLNVPVMADIGTTEQGVKALEDGADIIGTTLANSEPFGRPEDGPAIGIVKDLVKITNYPIIVEGQIWTLEEVKACFDAGAYAIVIGSAITVPQFITERFVKAIPALKTELSNE
ncbi:MAG: N-acetylmannosamine-6-phosphate 2-epimerase [Bacillota bacterium]